MAPPLGAAITPAAISPYTPLLSPAPAPLLPQGAKSPGRPWQSLQRTLAVLIVLVFVTAALFVALWIFQVYNIFGIPSPLSSSGPVFVPPASCTAPNSYVARLVYDPVTSNVVDLVGLNCVYQLPNSLGVNTVTASLPTSLVGPAYNGTQNWGMNIGSDNGTGGCSTYTFTLWVYLGTPLGTNNRILGVHSSLGINNLAAAGVGTAGGPSNPYPVTLWLYGCGLAVWGPYTRALLAEQWVHLAVSYDGAHTTYFINGAQVYQADPYSDPPPTATLQGILTLDTTMTTAGMATGTVPSLASLMFGESRIYCSALSAAQVAADAADVLPGYATTLAIPPVYPAANVPAPGPFPADFTFPFVTDTNGLHAYFCEFFSQADEAAIPASLPAGYVQVYVDMLNGRDTNLGIGSSAAWQTLANTAIFGNLAYDFAILSQQTMLANGVPTTAGPLQFPSDATTPAFSAGTAPSGCNCWSFTSATIPGSVQYKVRTSPIGQVYNGQLQYRLVDGVASFWLKVASITGTPYIGPTSLAVSNMMTITDAGSGTYTLRASSSPQSLHTPSQTVTTTLSYNTFYFVSFVWSCSNNYNALFINGAQAARLAASTSGALCNVQVLNPMNLFELTASNYFVGLICGSSMHAVPLTAVAVAALYRWRASPNAPCAIVEFCMALRMCQNDRHYGSQGVYLLQGTPQCPLVVVPANCGRGNGNYPMISGEVLLPQTSDIGWQAVQYTNPATGVTWETGALEYNLGALYALTGTTYLTGDPCSAQNNYQPSYNYFIPGQNSGRANFMPIVNGDLYMVPRAPNVDSPRYWWGNHMNHTLRTGVYTAGVQWIPTPGSWCVATYVQMFQKNTAKYMACMTNPNCFFLFDGVNIASMAYVYNDGGSYFAFEVPGGGAPLDCAAWYQAYILDTGLNYSWEDPQLLLVGQAPSGHGPNVGTTPGSVPVQFALFAQYNNAVPPAYTVTTLAPPFTVDPLATNPGGWRSSIGVFLTSGGATDLGARQLLFDAPGEYFYSQQTCTMTLFPWNAGVYAALLQRSSYVAATDFVQISLDVQATANWARVVDYNSQSGLAYGKNDFQNMVPVAQAIFQEVEVRGFQGWGIYINSTLPSRIENASLAYNLNGITLQVAQGHAFIVNTTIANTTQMNYQPFNMDLWGVAVVCQDNMPYSTCNMVDSAMVTHVTSSRADFLRGVSIIYGYAQSMLIVSNKAWFEHTLYNLSGTLAGDAGVVYDSATPSVLLYHTNAGTIQTNSIGLDPQAAMSINAPKAGFYRDEYIIGQPLYAHGLKALNLAFDWIGLSNKLYPYTLDVGYQFTSCVFTGSTSTYLGAYAPLVVPQTSAGAVGRPFLMQGITAVLDSPNITSYVWPFDYPVYFPGQQGFKVLWPFASTSPSGLQSMIQDYRMCYGMLDFSGTPGSTNVSFNQLSFNSPWFNFPAVTLLSRSNAVLDSMGAAESGQPAVQFGSGNCRSVRDTALQRLDNEAYVHYWSTQPAVRALIHLQIPQLYLAPVSTPSPTAQDWQWSMDRFDPSEGPWPGEPDLSPCNGVAGSCAPWIVSQWTPGATPSSRWTDSTGKGGAITSLGFNGQGVCLQRQTQYAGSSYDPVRGLVVFDTAFAYGQQWGMTYAGGSLQAFTLSFWLMVPPFANSNGVPNFCYNNKAGTLLDFLNGAAGSTHSTGTVSLQPAGSAAPVLSVGNSACCSFANAPAANQIGYACSSDTQDVGVWTHWTMVQHPGIQYTRTYRNGVPENNCASIVTASNPLPIFGGSTPMSFLWFASVQISAWTVYAGTLNDAAVANLYSAAAATYLAPAAGAFPTSNPVIDLTYDSTLSTYTLWPGYTAYTVAFLGQLVTSLVSDPLGQTSTPVIAANAQFSFPTPAGLTAWSLTVSVQWTTAPAATPWFSIATSPTVSQLMVWMLAGNKICLEAGVSAGSTPGKLSVTTLSCITASYALNQWTSMVFAFDSNAGTATLAINGGSAVSLASNSTLVGKLATRGAMLFQVPTQVWLYVASVSSYVINNGLVRSVTISDNSP